MRSRSPWLLASAILAVFAGAAAIAQPPPDIAAANRAIGKANDQPATARLYAPLAEKPPYREARITRGLSYGPFAENLLDIFQPARRGAGRTVLIYVSGGMGTRISGDRDVPGADAFYQNIMLWAVKHGMVAVNTDRRPWRGQAWDTGARDIAAMIAWTKANIARFGGDPRRIVFFGHGIGGTQLATYLAHREFWAGPTTGLAGAVLMSAPLNVRPLMGTPGDRPTSPLFEAEHSNLDGLKALDLPLYIGMPEFEEDGTQMSNDILRRELCRRTCPTYVVAKDHQHISLTYAFNTQDVSVSAPLLRWVRTLRNNRQP